jgi:integrase
LGHLVEYRLANEISALSKSRQKNFRWFTNCLETEFPFLKDIEVQKITPAVIEEILPRIKQRNGRPYKPRSYNELVGQIKSLIEIAIRRGIIPQNPFVVIPRNKKRRTVKDSPTETPSFEQFWLIVEQIRNNRFTDHSEESANFVAFMGCAGLGAAEVRNIKWSDIKRESNRIKILRVKTGEYFEIPIYPELVPVIDQMECNRIKEPTELLFTIKSVPKKALASACTSLGYQNFTPRSLRKMRITDLLRKDIHYKVVSQWQGHQDGGLLILKTYSNIFSESNTSFESVQVAKLYDQHKQEQSEQ